MEEFRGTPGPWSLDQFDNVVHGQPDNWGRKENVRVSGVTLPGLTTEEYLANTQLVAAAPELFEALRSLYHAVLTQPSGGTQMSIALERTRDTLNKALGK